MRSPSDSFSSQQAEFPATHWSTVLAAGEEGSPQARDALTRICEKYWYPLYAYVRRRGYRHQDAQDLTQSFLAVLLEKNYLRMACRERGKFRSFLLSSLKHFLANEWDRSHAQKRGGGQVALWSELPDAEARYEHETPDPFPAEVLFDRRWALTLLEESTRRLREEWGQDGKGEIFERLKVFLAFDSEWPSYEDLSRELGLSEGAVKVTVCRLRRRFREILCEEIAHTVERSEEVEGEIRYLIKVLKSGGTRNPSERLLQ